MKPPCAPGGAPTGGAAWTPDLTDWDHAIYRTLVAADLSVEQRRRIAEPTMTFPRQREVLAVHWHPEFVGLDLIRQRVNAMFPAADQKLIIPTQHNVLVTYDGYTGVEVDCYSASFDRKVQLLVHFEEDRVERADVLRSMLSHTFRYRTQQLFEFIDTIINPAMAARLSRAADESGADDTEVEFLRVHARKLLDLFHAHEADTPVESIRNKLLLHYVESLLDRYDENLVHAALRLLRAAKKIVKQYFSNEFFYRTEEVIEEVRSLGGCLVIPHPEQFWPILLADYDVDGYEVWNPQSQQYTDFLIHVVARQNRSLKRGSRPLLIFMGDDCHMGEKAREPRFQEPEKAGREIGVQPAWDDLRIRKSLITATADRGRVIAEYKARLRG